MQTGKGIVHIVHFNLMFLCIITGRFGSRHGGGGGGFPVDRAPVAARDAVPGRGLRPLTGCTSCAGAGVRSCGGVRGGAGCGCGRLTGCRHKPEKGAFQGRNGCGAGIVRPGGGGAEKGLFRPCTGFPVPGVHSVRRMPLQHRKRHFSRVLPQKSIISP